MIEFIVFIIGICFGSFTNVLIDRIPKRKSILIDRSHCDHCKKKISFYDLIPVLSYILLSGKCRYCKKRIGIRVLLVEILTGVLFVALYISSFISILSFALLCAILITLIAISFIDIEHGIIPDSLLLCFGIASLILILTTDPNSILSHLITGIIAFIFFLVIFLITRGRGIGFGDVKYAFFIGFFLSWQNLIVAFYVAFLTGALISLILVIVGKKKLKGGTIVFGPFLSLGVLCALLFGNQIENFAFKILGL